MRKVTFAVLAIMALLVGCTSIDCSMNNLVMNHSAFIKHRENSSDTIAKLDGYYVTVSALNTDSSKEVVLVNRDFEPSELRMLMSSILEDETGRAMITRTILNCVTMSFLPFHVLSITRLLAR